MMPGETAVITRSMSHAVSPRERGSAAGAPVPIPPRLVGPLRALGEPLQRLEQAGAGWEAWIREAPFVPEIEGQIHLSPLEKTLDQKLGHLAEVCFRPRAYLRLELERVSVARARRVPPRSYAELAAHPEDWERRTLRAVVPRKVQAQLPEDELDLYENRVAVRLVDHLSRYLARRIQHLGDLKRLMDQAKALQEAMEGGNHWARHRASLLIGDLFANNQGIPQVEATLRELERLNAVLSRLQASRLYRIIPNRSVSATLTPTNILVNDQRYRQVAALWRSWVRWGRQLDSKIQLEADWRHFTRFSVLVVLRAVELFRLVPAAGIAHMSIQPGMTLPLEGRLGRFTLIWKDQETLVLQEDTQSGAALQICLGPTAPSPSSTPGSQHALWLYPGLLENGGGKGSIEPERHVGESADRQAVTASMQVGEKRGLLRVPVSPLELGCVERVMREIQRWLLNARFLAYPESIALPSVFPAEVLELWKGEEWLRQELPLTATSTKPGEKPGLSSWGRAARTAARGTTSALGSRRLQVLQVPRENGTKAKALIAQLRHYLDRLPAREREDLAALDPQSLEDRLIQALDHVKRLRVCPVCPNESGAVDFKPRGQTFVCRCESCGSQWETRECRTCRERFGVLEVKGRTQAQVELEALTGLQSKDVLAERRMNHTDSWGCPCCGC